MVDFPLRVLVVAPPGPWRDSLCVLLQANRLVAAVDEAGDVASGQAICRQSTPHLVLLDACLQDISMGEMIRGFQTDMTVRPCLVLTHSWSQELAARSAGASAVLPEGFSTIALYEALQAAVVRSFT